MSDCACQICALQNLLWEMQIRKSSARCTPLCADNQGAIFIAGNPVVDRQTKHIELCYHYVRERVAEKRIQLLHVPGDQNPADMFTKNLGFVLFHCYRGMLGMEFHSETFNDHNKP